MGVFDTIKEAIWGKSEQQPKTQVAAGGKPVAAQASPVASRAGRPAALAPAPKETNAPTAPEATTSSANAIQGTSPEPVDVEAVLDSAVKSGGQKLEWRRSIVDLMKALDLDSSLSNRKELADELGYTGDTNDSAKMNIWLHKALMKKLAENGGTVPASLAD